MPSALTTQELFNRVKKVIRTPADKDIDFAIEQAIIDTDRELWDVDDLFPLAWGLHPYDGLRTVPYAEISGITQASPGVVTAETVDSETSGHGFHNHATIRDVVYLNGIDGMEELNDRLFCLEYIDADTFSLKTLDGLTAVDTTNYTEYSAGGAVYHAGFVLNTTTILTGITAWTFGGIPTNFDAVSFDGYPSSPVPLPAIVGERFWDDPAYAERPKRYRYWRNYSAANTMTHYLLWYPFASDFYNVAFRYLRQVPEISTFDSTTYPFHPAEVHQCIVHGALSKLAGEAKRMQRQNERDIVTKMEVLWAEKWMTKWERDKRYIRRLSRHMLGMGGLDGFTA